MVITRADDDTREARLNKTVRRDAAFAWGAQIVQTDFAAADPASAPIASAWRTIPPPCATPKPPASIACALKRPPRPVRTATRGNALSPAP